MTISAREASARPRHNLAFLLKQREKLKALRAQITESLNTNRSNIACDKDAIGSDAGDKGSMDVMSDTAFILTGKDFDTLRDIDDALRKIDAGEYGICEMTGELIPVERLEVLPFTRLTVAAMRGKERLAKPIGAYGVRTDEET